MNSESLVKAFSTGLADILEMYRAGYSIQNESVSVSEICDPTGLLPVFFALAYHEVKDMYDLPDLMSLQYDQETLVDCLVGAVPTGASLPQLLQYNALLLERLQSQAEPGRTISLDDAYKAFYALVSSGGVAMLRSE
jgi:hypothetical protein